jgi:hypothetical protein
MLIGFQTLLTLMPGNQLNLTVRQSFGRQIGEHLMAEQMRMHRLCNPGLRTILLHNLLNASRGKGRGARRLKEIPVFRMRAQMAL